jgi:hypothetical protein
MNRQTVSSFAFVLMLAAGGAMVSAQVLLPSTPMKQFGASISPAFEGWYDNPDGTHTFLIGYYSRNTKAEVVVPIGPNNHFEPGNPDMGQPTHFMPSRRYGMFTFTMPKEFGKNQKVSWMLTVNGVTQSIPFYMAPDYNVSPLKSSEESATGGYNLPPVIRFLEKGPTFAGPTASVAKTVSRTVAFGTPLTLDIWADDDAKYSSGTNAPMNASRQPVTLSVSKYRGPGEVTFDSDRPKLEVLKGGRPDEPYSGKASTTVKFSQTGDYMLHVTANDYSGNGGGGSVCCWTTAIVSVSVKGVNPATTGQ